MISYVMIGTNDLARAARFYDAVMAALGHGRCSPDPDGTSISWGQDEPGQHVTLSAPFDGGPAGAGNGTMLSLRAASRAQVDAAHAAALAHGGHDEGAPGLRPRYGPGFYAAYMRDPDGNKLNAVCYGTRPGD